jgi:hypothetical protein
MTHMKFRPTGFTVEPQDRGQIVEVSYSFDDLNDGIVLQRVRDQSDGSVVHYVYGIADDLDASDCETPGEHCLGEEVCAWRQYGDDDAGNWGGSRDESKWAIYASDGIAGYYEAFKSEGDARAAWENVERRFSAGYDAGDAKYRDDFVAAFRLLAPGDDEDSAVVAEFDSVLRCDGNGGIYDWRRE